MVRAQFAPSDIIENEEGRSINWPLYIEILMNCWEEIPTTEILNAWSNLDESLRNKPEDEGEQDNDKSGDYQLQEDEPHEIFEII